MDNHHQVSLELTGDNLNFGEGVYQEGVPDFNGNYQVPAESEPYVLIYNKYKDVTVERTHVGFALGDIRSTHEMCDANSEEFKFVFEKVFENYYRIKSQGGYIAIVNNKVKTNDVDATTIGADEQDNYLFRLQIEANGGVNVINKNQGKKSLIIDKDLLSSKNYNSIKDSSFFFLRKDCGNF